MDGKQLQYLTAQVSARQVGKTMAMREAEIKRALGKWVSEIEPSLIYERSGPGHPEKIVGIGHAGKVVIPCWPI